MARGSANAASSLDQASGIGGASPYTAANANASPATTDLQAIIQAYDTSRSAKTPPLSILDECVPQLQFEDVPSGIVFGYTSGTIVNRRLLVGQDSEQRVYAYVRLTDRNPRQPEGRPIILFTSEAPGKRLEVQEADSFLVDLPLIHPFNAIRPASGVNTRKNLLEALGRYLFHKAGVIHTFDLQVSRLENFIDRLKTVTKQVNQAKQSMSGLHIPGDFRSPNPVEGPTTRVQHEQSGGATSEPRTTTAISGLPVRPLLAPSLSILQLSSARKIPDAPPFVHSEPNSLALSTASGASQGSLQQLTRPSSMTAAPNQIRLSNQAGLIEGQQVIEAGALTEQRRPGSVYFPQAPPVTQSLPAPRFDNANEVLAVADKTFKKAREALNQPITFDHSQTSEQLNGNGKRVMHGFTVESATEMQADQRKENQVSQDLRKSISDVEILLVQMRRAHVRLEGRKGEREKAMTEMIKNDLAGYVKSLLEDS